MRITNLILFCAALSTSGPLFADEEQSVTSSWDVPGVEEMHFAADFWVDRIENPGLLLKTREAIEEFNQSLFIHDKNMVDLALFPEKLPGIEVRKQIQAISRPNKSDLYNVAGEKLTAQGYEDYSINLGLDSIPDEVKVQFALVVRRSDMRAYPTDDRYYKSPLDQNLDRFQENGLFPGDALAVLHVSIDGLWAFVQSYNYTAWVRKDYIAIGDRRSIQAYRTANRFLVITGDKAHTNFNPELPALSELQLDMGLRYPLAEQTAIGNNLYGQNPYTSHAVLLPVRNLEGKLEIKPALISRNRDVSQGFIPFTPENIIRQSFKFLGERYGWGHSYNARDCTGFVMEVYKSFGIQMPRNTGQQGSGDFGKNIRFNATSSREEKLQAIKAMDVGDLIYVPGHVLMVIGQLNGEPYVIHDVSEFRYFKENGDYYKGVLNGVSVTPLMPLYGTRESTYIDLMYNIKSLR